MTSFLKLVLIFALLPVVVGLPLDLLLSNQLKQSTTFAHGEIPVWNDLYGGKIDSDMVVYGSSRAWVHIDPSLLSKRLGYSSYNLGINGHNFWLQYYRHQTLLKYNKKPKYIIMSVDVFSLEKKKDLYNSEQFLPFMLFDRDIMEATESYAGFKTIDYYLPFIRYIKYPKAIAEPISHLFLEHNTEVIRNRGYKGMDKKWTDDLANAKKEMDLYEAKLDQPSIKLFDDFLSECKKTNIKVILVYAPEYVEGQEFVKNRGEIIDIFKRFSDKFDVPFIDYSNDELRDKKEYFYNAGHLNRVGAEIFTNKLVDDLMEGNPKTKIRNPGSVPIIRSKVKAN